MEPTLGYDHIGFVRPFQRFQDVLFFHNVPGQFRCFQHSRRLDVTVGAAQRIGHFLGQFWAVNGRIANPQTAHQLDDFNAFIFKRMLRQFLNDVGKRDAPTDPDDHVVVQDVRDEFHRGIGHVAEGLLAAVAARNDDDFLHFKGCLDRVRQRLILLDRPPDIDLDNAAFDRFSDQA